MLTLIKIMAVPRKSARGVWQLETNFRSSILQFSLSVQKKCSLLLLR